ncbi:hypothetical protein NPIL_406741 [Nephila pilipes]|uniref:Uncharacterized protein n=1 Tax=Nephila pilipes TaxID=299642 RepID=A0A8X6MV95_NEPPI|nr:hypothetical protein NPIL_406741 [Nephila pilipes]
MSNTLEQREDNCGHPPCNTRDDNILNRSSLKTAIKSDDPIFHVPNQPRVINGSTRITRRGCKNARVDIRGPTTPGGRKRGRNLLSLISCVRRCLRKRTIRIEYPIDNCSCW